LREREKRTSMSSPITYITKYTIEHYNIELHEFIVNEGIKRKKYNV
jgi:hypothetical protein